MNETLSDNKQKSKVKKSPTEQTSLLLKAFQFGFRTLGSVFPRLAANYAFKLFATPRNKKSSGKSSAIMEEARQFTIDFKNRSIQCYTWGKTGPKVLLAHGWESKGAHLQNFVPPLLEMGYQVIAFDAPAHGQSTGKLSNLVDFGETQAEVAKHVKGIDYIVAHSMGSGAAAYALSQPELQYKAKKLVMITSPNRLQDVFAQFYSLLHIPQKVQHYFELKVEGITGRSIEYFQIAERLKDTNADQYLLIHDKDDNVIPLSYGERIVAKNPKVKMWVTKGKGHYKIIKDREVIETVVEFLEA